jgi:hypothetical protein
MVTIGSNTKVLDKFFDINISHNPAHFYHYLMIEKSQHAMQQQGVAIP